MKISVMSFNVRCANDADGHSIAERAPRIGMIFDKYKPDVIGIQEYRTGWESCFDEYLKMGYDMYYVPKEFNRHQEAVPVMWKKDRFECMEKNTFWLSDTPEKDSGGWDEKYDVNRLCSYVVLKHRESGVSFVFMNTHFGFGDSCQTRSAELINKYSNEYEDIPVFVTGDFNMKTDSAGYKRMTEFFTDVNTVTANDRRCTYHGYAPEKHSESHVDFCFVNDKVKPLNYKLVTETFEGKYPSDHYGLLIELDV